MNKMKKKKRVVKIEFDSQRSVPTTYWGMNVSSRSAVLNVDFSKDLDDDVVPLRLGYKDLITLHRELDLALNLIDKETVMFMEKK